MADESQSANNRLADGVSGRAVTSVYEDYWLMRLIDRLPAAYWVFAFVMICMPIVPSDFVLYQIFSWGLILGMIGLSLMFIGGYGGMVSLAQLSIAGLAGYLVAILGTSAIMDISLGWPWWLAVPVAVLVATVFATITGMLAVRTEGIYTIIITLAIAAAFFYFTRQNYTIFNGFSGFNGISPPRLFGVDWSRSMPFYYLTLLIAAFAVAGFIAALGGVLLVCLNGQISPGTIAIAPSIDILIIAFVGGLRRPIGPFIGALIYVVLRTFSLDVLTSIGLAGERFQLLIGLGFLIIVYWSPDGVLGLWDGWRERRRAGRRLEGANDKRLTEGSDAVARLGGHAVDAAASVDRGVGGRGPEAVHKR